MIKELIKQLDGAELFLRNRADAEYASLNEYDIETMYGISELINKTIDLLEKSVIPPFLPGDKVYSYCSDFDVVLPYEISEVRMCLSNEAGKMSFCFESNCFTDEGELLDTLDFDEDDIGKMVFSTEEEAERDVKESGEQ